tara:strand:+ start:556 stop:1050 length:495 start_codon:yes stop_codon:yes gene_type:complete
MSLNYLSDGTYSQAKPWMNIRANNLSFGDTAGQIKTQATSGNWTIGLGTLGASSPLYYTCDHTSLRIRGWVELTTAITPHNNFTLSFDLPTELVARFGTNAAVIATGNVCEHPNNNGVNNGSIAYGDLNITNNGVNIQIFWNNGNVNTAFGARVYLDCNIFKQG